MDAEHILDFTMDKRSETSNRSLDDLKLTLKRNVELVFENNQDFAKPPKLHCPGIETKSCCDKDSCSCDNSSSDLSECSDSLHSFTSSTLFDDCTSSVRVKCLEPYEDLQDKCRRLGLEFVDDYSEEEEREYEVELVLEHKFEEGEKYYLVKWKNWDMKTNTWEPEDNLTGCRGVVRYYETLQSPRRTISKDTLAYFVKELVSRKPYDNLSLIKVVSIVTGTQEEEVKDLNLKTKELRLKAKGLLELSQRRLKDEKEKIFELMRFSEARKPVLINLKEWERTINAQNPSTYIEVENHEDLEGPPADFQFIHDYVAEEGIDITGEPAVFCECKEECRKTKKKCCPSNSDAHFAYNKFRRLQLLPGHPIFECNKNCRCDENCANRVVQHGTKVKVAVFRTSNGCGWGLKTLETIQKDQFVVEYLGEILTSEAAEIRGREYDNVGRSYLFDLDYATEDCKYTVDAGHLGNASHFINHSCDPNLHVFAVWINNQDPNLPRLAFFAKKKISRGEELTFDYKMVKGEAEDTEAASSTDVRVPCKCNAQNCRKYLF